MNDLKQGASGPQVVDLQSKLKQLGFSSGIVDGKFGPGTKKAVMAFQKSKGITADGVAGPVTFKALTSAIKKATDNKGDAPSDPKSPVPLNLLTESDFKAAARLLNCDIAAIKAVAEVESSGSGFLSDGRVKILFEGHQFHKHTKGAYAESHPTIWYMKSANKHISQLTKVDVHCADEFARLERTMSQDCQVAIKSES